MKQQALNLRPRTGKPITHKRDMYDRENLAIARAILATDEQGIRREWARLVVEKARLVVERKGAPK